MVSWPTAGMLSIGFMLTLMAFGPGEKIKGPPVQKVERSDNPFMSYKTGNWGFYRPHPFVDYTGAHVNFGEPIDLDYFGYRNDQDLYFTERRDYALVVVTGGSEAAGLTHRTTIAQHLERMLNKNTAKKVKVLNLAVNSYCLSNEISAYVHLAYHLRPEVVISHTGWNDMLYGMMVPARFKQLGLIYMKPEEDWLPRWYELKGGDVRKGFTSHWRYVNQGQEKLTDGYIRNLEKYRSIVTGNGGKLIVGIQAYHPNLDEDHPLYGRMGGLYDELLKKLDHREDVIDFRQVPGITFDDSCHSTERSSLITAKSYAEPVKKALRLDH